MVKSKQFYIRKAHRYLGVLLGIQFLLWTIGGLYFSWSNMDEIHGDFEKKEAPLLAADLSLVSPTVVIDSIKQKHQIDSVISVQLIEILGTPYYQVRCMLSQHQQQGNEHGMQMMNHLANAATGKVRGPLTKAEAIALAQSRFTGEPKVARVEYLTQTDKHHEYREQPLPAYAISFTHASQATVYVATELGTVQKFRNSKWRIFDFLWMMHTMDYSGRDNFGNILLRGFSLFGLITVMSGFALYFVSSKRIK